MPFDDLLTGLSSVAVVPSLLGPLHTLMLVLPQIVLGLVLVAQSLTSPLVWREAGSRLWWGVRSRPLRAAGLLALVLGIVWSVWWLLTPLDTQAAQAGARAGGESWPTFHGSLDRSGATGLMAGETARTSKLRWQFHDALILERRPFASSPAVAGSRVLVASDNYKLYCVDLETGQLQWSFEARWPIFSSPAIWNGRVYIGEGLHYNTDCKFYCLDLATGDVLWSIQTGSHTESSPTVADGRVYFGAGDDGVYCADALTGEVIWQRAGPHVDGGPLVVGDAVYAGSGYSFQGVLCLDRRTGQVVWRMETRAPVWGAPAYAGGLLYIAVGNGNFNESDENPYGEVRCLDPRDGSDIWRFTGCTDGVHTSVAVSGGRAVFGARDGACYALDAATGQLMWRAEFGAPVLSSPAVVEGRVFVGADDGLFRCLDLADGHEVWSYDTRDDMLIIMEDPRIQSSPAVAGGKVIFGAANGNVYCLGAEEAHTAVVAQAEHRTRLMRAADLVTVGLIDGLSQMTGSLGWAIVLTALAFKLVVLPLDWKQSQQLATLQGLQPELQRLQHDYVDYRIHRFEVRALYSRRGIHPLSTLAMVLFQIPLLVLIVLIIQSTPLFAGRSFLWISDLAVADHAARIPAIAWLGSYLNALPVVLVGSVWVYSFSLRRPGGRRRILGAVVWLVVALGLGLLTYRWSAALLLFIIALLWIGVVELRLLSVRAARANGPAPKM